MAPGSQADKPVTVAGALATPHPQADKLFAAASGGDLSSIKALLAAGVNPNAKGPDGETALIMASQHGYLDVAKVLLRLERTQTRKGQWGRWRC